MPLKMKWIWRHWLAFGKQCELFSQSDLEAVAGTIAGYDNVAPCYIQHLQVQRPNSMALPKFVRKECLERDFATAKSRRSWCIFWRKADEA